MQPPISPLLYTVVLFCGMIILLEAGRLLGVRQRPTGSKEERGSLATIEGAVFAPFGLRTAFTFSGAAASVNEKRMLIAEEVNAVEVVYLRLQFLPEETRPAIQELFRQFVNSRVETYPRLPDMQSAGLEMNRSKKLQEKIWTESVTAIRLPGSHPSAVWLVLPAINNMIEIANTHRMALQSHPPGLFTFRCFTWRCFVPCWLVIEWQEGNSAVGFTSLASRSSRSLSYTSCSTLNTPAAA